MQGRVSDDGRGAQIVIHPQSARVPASLILVENMK